MIGKLTTNWVPFFRSAIWDGQTTHKAPRIILQEYVGSDSSQLSGWTANSMCWVSSDKIFLSREELCALWQKVGEARDTTLNREGTAGCCCSWGCIFTQLLLCQSTLFPGAAVIFSLDIYNQNLFTPFFSSSQSAMFGPCCFHRKFGVGELLMIGFQKKGY